MFSSRALKEGAVIKVFSQKETDVAPAFKELMIWSDWQDDENIALMQGDLGEDSTWVQSQGSSE